MRLATQKLIGFGAVFVLIVLTACSSVTSLPTDPPAPTNTVPAESGIVERDDPPTPIPTEAPTETPQPKRMLTQYQIIAELDDAQKTVDVAQTILYTNTTGVELTQIPFAVEPNRFLNGFTLESLTRSGSEQSLTTSLEKNWLSLQLAEPLPDGGQIELLARYRLQLPRIPPPSDNAKPQIYGFTGRQTNLVDWYLWIPPYDAQSGWLTHSPSFFGEYYVYPVADFKVEFRVKNASRPPVIAASSLSVDGGDNRWLYDLSAGRNFVLSLSPDYTVQETVIEGFVIRSYSFPFYDRAGIAALEHTGRAFQLYSDVFGRLPRTSLSVVQADFLDGMEFDGLYYLSKGFYDLYDGTPQGYLTMIAVHETAHQWWYALVANDQALHPWLDEALCTYSEKLYYEAYYPELVDWWWYYRINFFQPEGAIDLPVYDYPGFIPYRNAVYLRGALFLDELRALLGDEAFFAGLSGIVAQSGTEVLAPEEFFEIVMGNNTQNIAPLLEKYFSTIP